MKNSEQEKTNSLYMSSHYRVIFELKTEITSRLLVFFMLCAFISFWISKKYRSFYRLCRIQSNCSDRLKNQDFHVITILIQKSASSLSLQSNWILQIIFLMILNIFSFSTFDASANLAKDFWTKHFYIPLLFATLFCKRSLALMWNGS